MKLFQNLSIRKKVIGIILVISFISLSVVLGVAVLVKARADRSEFVGQIKQYAQMAGEYCQEALIAQDTERIRQNLSKLEAIPSITQGVIYGEDQNVLASYSRKGAQFDPPDPERIKPFLFTDQFLLVMVPISDRNQTYGEIFVRASVDELKRKHKLSIFLAAALFVIMFFFVYVLARSFQGAISKPILKLVTATKRISGSGEAGVRIKKKKKNELFILRDRLKYLLELENMREMKLEEVDKARKKAIELEKTRKEYQERFENNAYGIFVLKTVDNGQNFVIKDLNSTGEVMERKHRADLIGKKITQVFPEVRHSGLLRAIQNAWRNEEEEFIPYIRLRSDKKSGWREMVIHKLPSKDVMVLFRDVTDQKIKEESRKKQREQQKKKFKEKLKEDNKKRLMELNKGLQQKALDNELADFYDSMAKDWGDPLDKINTFSKSFLQDYAEKVDDEGKNRLIQIRAATHRIIKMAQKFDELADLSSDSLKLEKVDLSGMVKKRSIKLKEGNPEKKAEFVIQEGVTVSGDARLLNRVIDNLLTNAWIYSSRKENIRIEFGVRESKDVREYFIKDNGIGFETAEADQMFRPFGKLNPDEVFPGSGMGLTLVRRIIHKHGGTIHAQGKSGEGAVFYFTLGT
ncbi:MAG: PAS domain-containing protein [Candidatus Aminicenantes bacterium]|nr:PAS domain-containing protein [Candidatus Aminicenantes bacterium]